MHDINPMGTIMHLRELDRQAAPKLRAVSHHTPRTIGAGLGVLVVAFSGVAVLAWFGNL